MAKKLLGVSLKIPEPSCITGESFPCINSLALIIFEPKAWPMHWCPKHTPRIGILPLKFLITSRDIPASLGVHGPGDITKYSGK